MTTATVAEGPPLSGVSSTARGGAVMAWLYRSALVLAVAAAAYITVVPLVVQWSGTRLVTITSGSMTPLFPVGATIAVHDAPDPSTLEAGQIITFRALGNGTVITHRIVARIERPSLGQTHYQTKGDANRTPDPDLVPASNVIAVADGVLPSWQEFAVSAQSPRGRLLVYGGLFLIIAMGEIADLAGLLRRPRKAGAR
jgi:signal peptidase